MVVVESVALAITVSNDLVMPVLLRRRAAQAQAAEGEIGALVLHVRRAAILGVPALGYLYARYASDAALAEIGLLSFAAVAQIAPAFLGGLVWRRGTARGAAAGMAIGLAGCGSICCCCPRSPMRRSSSCCRQGSPSAQPAALTAFAPRPSSAAWRCRSASTSLAFVLVSLIAPADVDGAHAGGRLRRRRAARQGAGVPALARLGDRRRHRGDGGALHRRGAGAPLLRRLVRRARHRAGTPAPRRTRIVIRHAEHLLSPVIGASTSRLVLSLLLRRRAMSGRSALKMLDDASAAIQSSRDLLQHALDHARQGVTVFDANLSLIAWNRAFAESVRTSAVDDAPGPRARRHRAPQRRARRLRARRFRRLRRRAHRQPARPRRADAAAAASAAARAGGALGAAAGRRHRHHLRRHQPDRRLRGRARRRQREPGAARRRAHRRARTAQRGAQARQDGGRGRQSLQDPLSRRRQPRSLAAAQRARGSMRVRWSRRRRRALGRAGQLSPAMSTPRWRRSRKSSARCSTSPASTPARPGRRSSTSRSPTCSGQLEIEFAPMARAKGLKLTFVATRLAVRSDPAAAAAAVAEFRLQRRQIYAAGRVLVGVRGGAGRRGWRSGTPASASPRQARGGVRRVPPAGAGRAGGARPRARPVDRAAARARARPSHRPEVAARARLRLLGVRRRSAHAAPQALEAVAAEPAARRIRSPACGCSPSTTSRGCWRAWARCSASGAARSRPPPGSPRRLTRLDPPPDIVVADYHLDDGDGLSAIAAVRARLGADLPACSPPPTAASRCGRPARRRTWRCSTSR